MNTSLMLRFLLVAIVMWAAVWATLRQRRARSRNADWQSVRVENAAALAASLSATCGFVWLVADSVSLHWLLTVSLAAIIAFSLTSIILSGYAGWVSASR